MSFTGDPAYFHYRRNPPPPTPTPDELDDLPTTLFNAYYKYPSHQPMTSFAEIEKRGLQDKIRE